MCYPDGVCEVIKWIVKRWTLLALVVAILAMQQKEGSTKTVTMVGEEAAQAADMLAVMLHLAAIAKKRRTGQMLGLSFPVSANQPHSHLRARLEITEVHSVQ